MRDRAANLRNHLDIIGQTLTGLGLPAADILGRAGALDSNAAATDPPLELGTRIWHHAIEVSKNPNIPLMCGMQVPFGAYDVIDYMAAATATVGEGLTQLGRYFGILSTLLHWTIEPQLTPKRVRLRASYPSEISANWFTQYTLGVTVMRFRDGAEGELSFECAKLALPEPADPQPYRELFRCPLLFDQPETELYLPEHSWQLPMKKREASLKLLLQHHIEQLLAAQGEPDEALLRARVAVREALPAGPPRLVDIASKLAMSERTLQRRLRDGGASYQSLVDDERHQAALQHMRNHRLAVGDIAYLLGYSEASAFVRAFKRWTGTTPNGYRQEQ